MRGWKLDVDLCDSFKRAAAPPSEMGEIYLDKTLGLLSSDKQKERADGLAGLILSLFTTTRELNTNHFLDLKHILQQKKQSSKL